MNSRRRLSLLLGALLLCAGVTTAQERAVAPSGSRLAAAASPADYGSRGRTVRPTRSSGRAIAPSGTSSRRSYGRSSPSKRIWVPGRYETVQRRVWVPATYDRVWVEPVFGFQTNVAGIQVRVCLNDGYWRNVRVPGYWDERCERIWRPGYWQVVAYGR